MLNLLLIEDDEADFLLLQHQLQCRQDGARCHRVADAAALYPALAQGGWDVVLLDYHFPGMAFETCLAHVQSQLPEVPILLISGKLDEDGAIELLRAGVSDFIHKDHLVRLVPAVDRCLRDAAERRARKAVEQALRESEARLRTLVRTIPDLVWLKDPDGVYISCNPAFERFFGVPEAEIVGKTDYDFVDRDTADFFRHHDSEAVKAGRPRVNEEWLNYAADGRRVLVETIKTPMHDSDGRLVGVLGVARDITAARQAQEALRERERYQRALLDNFPFLVWLKDTDSRFLAVNKVFAAACGHADAMQLEGKTDFDVWPLELAEAYRADDRCVLEQRQQKMVEEEVFDQGVRRWFETYKAPVASVDGILLGTVGFARDISARKQAQEMLAESEARFRRLFEDTAEATLLIEGDRFVDANRAALSMLGLSSIEQLRDVPPARISPVIQPDGRDSSVKAREMIELAFARGSNQFEWEHLRSDGTVFTAEVLLTPITDRARHLLHVVWRDITERKKVEAALVESERTLREAQSIGHVGSWTSDIGAGTFAPSVEAARLVGWQPGTYATQALLDIVHPEDLQRMRETWAAALKSGSYEIEHRVVVGGVVRWFYFKAELSRDSHGRTLRAVGMIRDVTETREAQAALEAHRRHLEDLVADRTAALRQQARYLTTLIDNFPFPVWLKDTEGRYLAVNRAHAEVAGVASGGEIGRADRDIFPGDQADQHRAEDMEVMRSRQAISQQRVIERSGANCWFEVYKAPVLDEDGSVLGTAGFARDVSAQKAAAEAREAALEEAQRLARARGEFLANMSHEIRTPLNAVLGLAQAGLQKAQGEAGAATFTRILESGQHLLGIVDDVLDFSKIQAGRLTVECGRVEPGRVIDRAVDFTAARAYAKGLAFNVEEDARLPAAFEGDALRLAQVLMNLLSNAIKFTERGRVALEVECEGATLVLRVRDTGIGISRQQLARLFAPFEQADGSTTRRFGGTGLGLSISRHLVEAMGGEIRVASEEGSGSCFEVRLPLRQASERAAPLPGARRVALAGLGVDEAQPLANALTARGLRPVVVPAAEVPPQDVDLVVGGAEVLAAHGADWASGMLDRGVKVALACRTPLRAGDELPPGLGARVRLLESPLRARHVVALLEELDEDCPSAVTRRDAAGRLAGVRVLAAEDNDINRLVLEELLPAEGAYLECVENGQVALDRVRNEGSRLWDVVLMDIQMPVMDGYEAARRLREFAPDLPVIGLTAHAMEEERQRCLDAGMVAHLAKPIDLDALVDEVLRQVGASARNREPPAATPLERTVSEVPSSAQR